MNSILLVIWSAAMFILAVFPIVIIHEFGHFIVGKYLGAEPEVFSVGFGKELFSFQWLGATFKVCAIPLGGYVKFKKTQFDEELGEAKRLDADGKPVINKLVAWRWIPIALAGPFANFILTFVIFFGFFTYGLGLISIGEVTDSKIPGVTKGNNIFIVGESTLSGMISEQFFGDRKARVFYSGTSGVVPYPNPEKLQQEITVDRMKPFSTWANFKKSAELSTRIMGLFFTETANALLKIVSDKEGYKQVMGPMGMANEAQKASERSILDFLLLVASISFAIGFFNLLPLAFLDGGRVVLAASETIFRKSVSAVTLKTLNLMSLGIVFTLFAAGMFSDVVRLFLKK